jgi:hypothetical protein
MRPTGALWNEIETPCEEPNANDGLRCPCF